MEAKPFDFSASRENLPAMLVHFTPAVQRSASWPKIRKRSTLVPRSCRKENIKSGDHILTPELKARRSSVLVWAAQSGLEYEPTPDEDNGTVIDHMLEKDLTEDIYSRESMFKTPEDHSLLSSVNSVDDACIYSPHTPPQSLKKIADVQNCDSNRLTKPHRLNYLAGRLLFDDSEKKYALAHSKEKTKRTSSLPPGGTRRLITKIKEHIKRRFWRPFMSSMLSLKSFVGQEVYLPLSLIPDESRSGSRLQIQPFILNFLQFSLFTFIVCVDMFLSIFTSLPMRAFIGILRGLCNGFKSMTRREVHDLAMIFTGFSVCYVLRTWFLDVSFTYHWVKAQSTFKLYVLFNFIRIFDHLCCALGEGICSILFHEGSLMFYAIFMVYSMFHTGLMFLNLITLNVCMNSGSNSLITLIVSESFVELKSVVFKKLPKEVMLQISCSDVVEHFKNLIMVFLIYVQTFCHLPLERYIEWFWDKAAIIVILAFSELAVDLLKHGYLMKFNKHRAEMYRTFETRLAMDVLNSREYALRGRLEKGEATALELRMGFPALQFGCFTVKIVSQVLFANGGKQVSFKKKLVLTGLLWIGILIAKMLLGYWLTHEASRILEHNTKFISRARKINHVQRYTLIYKRIPV